MEKDVCTWWRVRIEGGWGFGRFREGTERHTEKESKQQGKFQAHLEESAGYSMSRRDDILKIKGLIAWSEMVCQVIGALRHSWPGC